MDKYQSGTATCWSCWNQAKLNLPAARHWAKVAEEFLSNVDMHDVLTYLPNCGLTTEEATTMLASARKVLEFSCQELADPWRLTHEAMLPGSDV
jgi:hypothetical protein